MTDQPSTQERCRTCGRLRDERYSRLHGGRCPNPWHGSQDVEGDTGTDGMASVDEPGLGGKRGPAPSTTQEAEKALRIVAEALSNADGAFHHPDSYGTRCVHEAEAALRSLRTQHTEQQAEIARLKDVAQGNWELARREHDEAASARRQHTKDREEIERLKRMNDEQAKTFDAMAERQARLQLQHTKDREEIERLKGEE